MILHTSDNVFGSVSCRQEWVNQRLHSSFQKMLELILFQQDRMQKWSSHSNRFGRFQRNGSKNKFKKWYDINTHTYSKTPKHAYNPSECVYMCCWVELLFGSFQLGTQNRFLDIYPTHKQYVFIFTRLQVCTLIWVLLGLCISICMCMLEYVRVGGCIPVPAEKSIHVCIQSLSQVKL